MLQLTGCGSEETNNLPSMPVKTRPPIRIFPMPLMPAKTLLSDYVPITGFNKLNLITPAGQLSDIRINGESMQCNSYAQYLRKDYYIPFNESQPNFSINNEAEGKVMLAKLCDVADECPHYLLQIPIDGKELYFATCKSNFFLLRIDGVDIHQVQFIKTVEEKKRGEFFSFIFLQDGSIYKFDSVESRREHLLKMRPLSSAVSYSNKSDFDIIIECGHRFFFSDVDILSNAFSANDFRASANNIFELSDEVSTANTIIKNRSSNTIEIINIWELEETSERTVEESCINKTLNPNDTCKLVSEVEGRSCDSNGAILIQYITR